MHKNAKIILGLTTVAGLGVLLWPRQSKIKVRLVKVDRVARSVTIEVLAKADIDSNTGWKTYTFKTGSEGELIDTLSGYRFYVASLKDSAVMFEFLQDYGAHTKSRGTFVVMFDHNVMVLERPGKRQYLKLVENIGKVIEI